jgi:hypothetical protein
VKRPLGILAAALLSLGVLGSSSPARAATTHTTTAATLKPAVPQDDDDHDWDHDDDGHGHRGRCHAVIAICIG